MPKLYEAIAEAFLAEGVDTQFTLMGDGNMWLWGAMCRNPQVKAYSLRHEAMSVSAADGYSRTTGKIGVAMVTCGPGLTQCGTSLIAAYRGKTPLVLIAGEIAQGAKNKTQSMDQRRFVEASSARFFTVTSADNMAEEIAEAKEAMYRAFVAIEGLTPEQILKRELDTGVPVVYRLRADSRPESVEVLA